LVRADLYAIACALSGQANRSTAPPLAWQAKLDSTACFWENKGQVRNAEGDKAEDVHYVLEQGGARIFLLDDGIAWQFERLHGAESMQSPGAILNDVPDEEDETSLLETFRMDTRLVGARPGAAPEGAGKRGSYANHYKHGALGAQGYSGADWRNVYPGIDWRVRATGKGVGQEFIVRPGADPSMIKLAFSHQEELVH
jgi:hypothetical protein